MNLYYLNIGPTGMSIGRSISSSAVNLGSWLSTLSANLKYRVRIRAVGSSHKARIWQASQPEPSRWNINVTDATYASGALNLQGGNNATANCTFDFDDYAVTKEG